MELLKERSRPPQRAGDPGSIASGIGQFGAVQAVAPSLGVELSPIDVSAMRLKSSAPSHGIRAAPARRNDRDLDMLLLRHASWRPDHRGVGVAHTQAARGAAGLSRPALYGPDYVDQFVKQPATSIAF